MIPSFLYPAEHLGSETAEIQPLLSIKSSHLGYVGTCHERLRAVSADYQHGSTFRQVQYKTVDLLQHWSAQGIERLRMRDGQDADAGLRSLYFEKIIIHLTVILLTHRF